MESENQGCFSWLLRGGFVWKNALVAEVGSLVFISISNFFHRCGMGAYLWISPKWQPQTCGVTKKTGAPQVDGATPHRSVAKESPNLRVFSPNLGVYKFTWPPVPALWKKREYFCCWKALVAQLGLKTTCFVGHIFHISNFWSRKRGTVSVGKNEVFPEVWSVGFHQPWSCNIKVKAVRDMVGIGHTGMSMVLSNWVITPI